LEVRQKKTHDFVRPCINRAIAEALSRWRTANPAATLDSYLFYRTSKCYRRKSLYDQHISENWVYQLIKSWCAAVGAQGNFGGHSLRRTRITSVFVEASKTMPLGQALLTAKKTAGHKKVSTTSDYLQLEEGLAQDVQMAVNL